MNAANTMQTTASEMKLHPDYKTEIVEVLRSPLLPRIKQERILTYHEKDIAEALPLLSAGERAVLYRILNADVLADILEYADNRAGYINEIGISKRIAVLSRFEISEMAECLRAMTRADRTLIMNLLDEELREQLGMLNSFDEDEIGIRMSTNFVAIRAGIGVRQATRNLIAQAAEHDNISTIYVVDENNLLLGAIDLKDLIIARDGTQLETIIMTSYPYVYATELIDDCLGRIREYSEDSIPVLDAESRLVGVLTSQELMDLVGDEMGEDYAKLAGLSAEEDLNESLFMSVKKRLPWLIVLLGLGLIVSGVVGAFEGVVAQLPFIIAFQSLILDMAGNVGTQSLAVTIRILMDENVSRHQKLFLVAKEARVGLANGLILGLLSFLSIGLYLAVFKHQPFVMAFSISVCTGLALLLAMIFSSLSGTLVPLFFKRLGVDPAVASGPLITTINDLIAVVTYYGLAWILIINLMHL